MIETTIDDYRDDAQLGAADLAAALGLNVQTIRRWIRQGRLPAIWIGGPVGYRVRASDVRAYLIQRSVDRLVSDDG